MAWQSVLYALLVFLPAYTANMAPPLVAKVFPKWNAPIDGGRTDRKGQRILGPGKTWRGVAGGIVFGAVTAVVVALLVPPNGEGGFFAGWDYGQSEYRPGTSPGDGTACFDFGCGATSQSPWWAIALFGGIMGLAALVGDAVKSYFKRRLGKERGKPWVPFDQLDFVVFGVAAMLLASPLLADGWVTAALLDDLVVLGTIVLLTPALHFLVNVLGYWLRLKEVPW